MTIAFMTRILLPALLPFSLLLLSASSFSEINAPDRSDVGAQLRIMPGRLHLTRSEIVNHVQTLKSEHWDQATGQKTTLHIRRLVVTHGPPVILSHAFVLNYNGVEKLGQWLRQRGYDVWMPNMVGHGNGPDRSGTSPYHKGDYSFDRIVTRDWPVIHKHVMDETGQRPFIIGYSMGGMTWQQYLSGVYWQTDSNTIGQSDSLARYRASLTRGFVALAVPEDLSKVSSTVKRLLRPMLPIFKNFRFSIPLTTSDTSHKIGGVTERFRRCFLRVMASFVLWSLPRGIVCPQKCNKDEFYQLIRSRISSPHTEQVADMIRWFHKPYTSSDGTINYGTLKRIYTKTLIIVASRDSLAPAGYTLSRSRLYPKETPVHHFEAKGFGHVDIAFEQGILLIGPEIIDFFERSP